MLRYMCSQVGVHHTLVQGEDLSVDSDDLSKVVFLHRAEQLLAPLEILVLTDDLVHGVDDFWSP